MKLKFKDQQFQIDATAAVCDVFEGQPYYDPTVYTVDPGRKAPKPVFGSTVRQENLDLGIEPVRLEQMELGVEDDPPDVGYANAEIKIDGSLLLKNLHMVQDRNNLDRSQLASGLVELEVEMETGTGKTFVYTKTIFELNKRYGWSKFIIIVPGVAIREGVKKSIDITAEKFFADYGKTAKTFIYNSSHPQDILDFSTNPDIQIIVMNVQAFNARSADARRIFMALDEFGSRKPIDLIAANRPILILDEPQKMEGTATQEMLPKFNPLFILRYSATHKTLRNLVYKLDAIDAFDQKLVKKIEPICIDVTNRAGNTPYVYLSEVRPAKDEPEAIIEIQRQKRDGSLDMETRVVRTGDDLYVMSGKLAAYAKGYTVVELNAKDGYGKVVFENGKELVPGKALGNVSEARLRRIQIREAIKAHLQKESQLFAQGIKVLTLFFIDEVAKYRVYGKDDAGTAGEYAKVFEEEYAALVRQQEDLFTDEALKAYWRGISAADTHAGYFAEDKHHRFRDSSEGRRGGDGGEKDVDAYDLILKNKERLLSLEEKVRFIFSHSALREGWDNPNVFVICPLKKPDVGNAVARRQEIGRGLRLCVNSTGDRQDDPATVHATNVLTIIANEGFVDYVKGLQSEIMESCARRPFLADADFFKDRELKITETVVLESAGGETIANTIHVITSAEAKAINKWLYKNDYIGDDDQITPKWREAKESDSIAELPESLKEIEKWREPLIQLVSSVYDKSAIKRGMFSRQPKPLAPNKNIKKSEFVELWKRINHKTVYTVKFDSMELVKKSIEALNKEICIPKITYTVRTGSQVSGSRIVESKSRVAEMDAKAIESGTKYDLVGKIAAATTLTRKTVAAILKGMMAARFEQFSWNPEKFISECIRIIKEQMGSIFVECIEYKQLDETFDSNIFATDKIAPELMVPIREDGKTLKKHIYDYLLSDSKGERKFARELDNADEVEVFAKLPSGFKIPTPVGDYNPDWAVAFKKGKVKYLYFVAETKGSLSGMELRKIEQAKISYAEKHFKALSGADFKYHVVTNYEDLLAQCGVNN